MIILEKIQSLPLQDKPILLIEPADNIGGGTPGDATDLLSHLLQSDHEGIVAIINDPAAAQEWHQHHVGEEIELNIGAKFDDLQPEDIEYVVAPEQTESPGGTLYSEATIKDNSKIIFNYFVGLVASSFHYKPIGSLW